MTNEEKKANAIYDRFLNAQRGIKEYKLAKQSALICVEEIIENLKEIETYKDVNENMPIGYWQTIKQIIEQL